MGRSKNVVDGYGTNVKSKDTTPMIKAFSKVLYNELNCPKFEKRKPLIASANKITRKLKSGKGKLKTNMPAMELNNIKNRALKYTFGNNIKPRTFLTALMQTIYFKGCGEWFYDLG
ncbi:MAG: hypothetical protein MK212_00230 [Saprospiraceae bacterium]|nr:hypothetical protein [Saprospiraceae bacterium]